MEVNMNRFHVVTVVLFVFTTMLFGCSTMGNQPLLPDSQSEVTDFSTRNPSQTHLWGIYDIYFDLESQQVEVIPNHHAMFTANVTTFINGNPANLAFDIHGTPVMDAGVYVDVDIDVSITHPFPGIHQYDGYDVRGVFMGAGNASMMYGDNPNYASCETDQHMKDYNSDQTNEDYYDPYEGPTGDPDGYTRWFNANEFPAGGVLGYVPGKLATPGYTSELTAELNPYKYYADGLGPDTDLWTWLQANADTHGIFTAGATNVRNYYLRFPMGDPGVKYGYAVIATWGEPPDEDPLVENAVEAIACNSEIIPNIWHDGVDSGGDFIADVSLWAWDYQPSTIYIETTVHDTVESFDPPSVVTGGNENYSTYHIEFTCNDVNDSGTNEYWVIAECGDFGYTGKYPAPAPDATLAAFFRYDLFVNNEAYNADPIVDSGVDGKEDPFLLATETYSVTAHDDDGDPLSYSWTVTESATSTEVITDDPGNGDGTIDIDWGAVGAGVDEEFDIDCSVLDGNGGSADATPLHVTASVVLFYDDMESGEGNWEHDYEGPNNGWGIVSGGNDGNWWHSNMGSTSKQPAECARLFTPEITIPAGVSEAHLEFYHEARGYFVSNTVYEGPALLSTYDGGSHLNKVVYPMVEGPQYDNWTYPYTSTYHFGLAWVCAPFDCWGVPSWTTVYTPTTSKVDVSSEIGKTLRFSFIYGHGLWYHVTSIWAVDDVKVTVVP